MNYDREPARNKKAAASSAINQPRCADYRESFLLFKKFGVRKFCELSQNKFISDKMLPINAECACSQPQQKKDGKLKFYWNHAKRNTEMINLLLSDSNYKHIFHPTDTFAHCTSKLISTTQMKSCIMSVGDQLFSLYCRAREINLKMS